MHDYFLAHFNFWKTSLFIVAMAYSVICLAPTAHAQNNDSQTYDSQAKKIDKEIKRIEQNQEKQQKDKKKLHAQLKQTNQKLNKVNKQLNRLDTDIRNQEQLVSKLKNSSEKNKGLQEIAQSSLAALMFEYTKTQNPNFFLFLLDQQDINNLDRQQTYFKYFSKARKQQINLLRIDLQDAQLTTQEYQQRKKSLQEQYYQQKNLQKNIATTTKEKTKILNTLDNNIAENTSTIKKLKTRRKRLSALITRLQKQRQASSKKEFIPAQGGFSQQKGRMLYPISGRIVKSYGQKNKTTGLSANGLAMRANKTGENSIRSIYEGRVIFSNWLKGFGNLIIIEHGQGYMSLYGNNQVLNKKEGDIVAAREAIAVYQQDANNHFYFEIRRKGKATNPKPWFK